MAINSKDDVARRRTRLAYLLLTGTPRSELADRLEVTSKTVARDLKSLAAAVGADKGSNAEAAEQTLSELERLGRLEKIDRAQVQAIRSMAAALDVNPFNSQMFAEYRSALGDMTADGDSDGAVEALLRELST